MRLRLEIRIAATTPLHFASTETVLDPRSWLAEAQSRVGGRAEWDGCLFVRDEYDLQASFNVATVSDRVKRDPGPVILIQKVQHSTRNRLEQIVGQVSQVISSDVWDTDSLWSVLEAARVGYEEGHPLISLASCWRIESCPQAGSPG